MSENSAKSKDLADKEKNLPEGAIVSKDGKHFIRADEKYHGSRKKKEKKD